VHNAIIEPMETEADLVKQQAYHRMYLYFPRPYFIVPSGERGHFSEQLLTEADAFIAGKAPYINPETVRSFITAYEELLAICDAPTLNRSGFNQSLERLTLFVNNPLNIPAWQVTLIAGESAYAKIQAEAQIRSEV